MIAYSGEQALPLIRDGAFALVLLDNHMPGMSGLDVLRARAADRAASRAIPPIVMVSSDPSGRTEALRLGASGFTVKTELGGLVDTLSRYAGCDLDG